MRGTKRQVCFHKLCRWVENNKQRLLDLRPTHKETAEWASKDLGWIVSHATITSAKEATEISWVSKRTGGRRLSNKLSTREITEWVHYVDKSLREVLGTDFAPPEIFPKGEDDAS